MSNSAALHCPSSWANRKPRHISLPLPHDNIGARGPILACSEKHIVIALGNTICVYSFPGFAPVHVLRLPKIRALVKTARICKDLLVAATNLTVYVWDLESGRCTGALGEQSATVGFFRISISLPEPVVEVEQSDGMEAPLLVVAQASFDVETWMLRTYILADNLEATKAEDAPIKDSSCILPLVKGIDVIHEVHCLESFGRTSVTAGPDGSVRIWDILTGECKMVLIGHAASVDDVQIDQHRVYSSSTDLTARIWDRHSGDCLHILKPAVPSQLTVYVQATQRYVITASYISPRNSTVCIWDQLSARLIHRLDGQVDYSIGVTPEKDCMLVTKVYSEDAKRSFLNMWDIETGRLLRRLSIGHGLWVRDWSFQEGFVIAIGRRDIEFSLDIWDFRRNGEFARDKEEGAKVSSSVYDTIYASQGDDIEYPDIML